MLIKKTTILITLVSLLVSNTISYAQDSLKITLSGHIPADSIFKLVYVPFKVPAGITEIRVKEIYANPGKNVLNLGVYGPEGYQVDNTAGFRGWSGGAKTEFFLNAAEASTGYIPGKIKAGTWKILIYPSTIIPEGIDWQLEITLIPGVDKSPFKINPALEVVNNTPGWYRGDLHMHTYHSDGKRTQQELLDEAMNKGLGFIISTEHNTNSANLSWGQYKTNNLLVINGEEVTTTAFGHWNAIGLNTETLIDWRYAPGDNVISTYLKQVHADSGLAIINHPFYNKEHVNSFGFDVNLFDGIEVWNGKWDPLDELAVNWWDSLLRLGKAKIAIAASDSHTPVSPENALGTPQTVVKADGLSRPQVMTGLRAGKAYLALNKELTLTMAARSSSASANIGETLATTSGKKVQIGLAVKGISEAVVITLVGDKGIIATEKVTGNKAKLSWQIKPGSTKYLRVEIRTPQGDMLALTNPIWLR